MAAIVTGRRRLSHEEGRVVHALVDMSGRSNDDAVLAIASYDSNRGVTSLNVLMAQTGALPFNPRDAVRKFVSELNAWGLTRVTGDAYAGQTFRLDFEDMGIAYSVSQRTKSEIYDAFEPKLGQSLLSRPPSAAAIVTTAASSLLAAASACSYSSSPGRLSTSIA
jgi:hypothetical protein